MRKRILAIILCLFSLFIFCGCGNINYNVTVSSDGAVTLSFDLEFNTQDINDSPKSLSDFVYDVSNVANTVVKNSCNSFEEKVMELAKGGVVKTYSGDMTVSQVILYVYTNMSPNNKTASVEFYQKNNKTYGNISLKFLTYNAYRYFNGIFPETEDEEDEDVITERVDKTFVVEDKTYSNSVFTDLQNNEIAKHFLSYFNNYFNLNDMKYSFSYSTQSPKMYSDAKYVYTDENGNNVHVWEFSADELGEDGGRICTYSVKIRAWVWYILALVITFVVGVILTTIGLVKAKKKRTYLKQLEKTANEIEKHNFETAD